MGVNLTGWEELARQAVAHYWSTLEGQGSRQREGDADRGGRAAVTGGKQMDGFCSLVTHVLVNNGLTGADIYLDAKLELPGYFRPTKKWDMLVIHGGTLLAAMEFKSHKGPSFGNNFNNRTEEAIGTAHDLATAYREGAFGKTHPRPWLGWVMLLEDCPGATSALGVKEPHFPVFPEFRGTSYSARYELMMRKLVREKLYDAAAFLMSPEKGGRSGEYREPAEDLAMKRFLAGLGGRVATYLASL